MISPTCRIDEFVHMVINQDYLEIIFLAEKEATEAERNLFQPNKVAEDKKKDIGEYARTLKDLMDYLRFSVKPSAGLNDECERLFRGVLETLEKKRQRRAIICRIH